jgi:hypothetical protein
MQPTNPNQIRGSFSKPASMTKAIAEHEATRNTPDPQPTPEEKPKDKPEEEKQISPEDLVAAERKKGVEDFKKMCKEDLDLEITDEDLRTYLFKGALSKEVRINKLMKGTFRSLRTNDLQEIDQYMAKKRSEGKYTVQGLNNEEAVINLAYAWTHVDGKILGSDHEEREKKIRQMGSTFVGAASDARINFETLIKIALHSIDSVKK